MRIKNLAIFVLFFLFLTGQAGIAQSITKEPLQNIIYELENKFDVRFNYLKSDVEDISIADFQEFTSLNDALRLLEERTKLSFTLLENRYVIIKKNVADKYCGKIISATTGVPIENVSILISATTGTSTNTEGVFTIDITEKINAFEISHVGYETITINITELNENCPTIYLHPSIENLEAVFINNFLVKGIQKNNNGSISIDAEKFGLLPGQIENDVLQIAQALPGIESIDETISNINIRGGTHSENAIFWDDIKMYQNGHFFGLISAFNPDITERVTIYKNGTPARYAESTSGVIAMYSSDKIAEQAHGGLGVNLIDVNGNLSLPISEKIGLQISARSSINSILETPTYNSYTRRIFQDSEIENEIDTNSPIKAEETFQFYDASAKLLYRPNSKNTFTLNFLTIDNQLDYLETNSLNNQSKNSKLDQRSIAAGVTWSRKWNDKLSTYAQGYISYYLLNALNKDIFTTQELIQDNEVIETGIKVESAYLLSDKFSIKSGYHFTETGIANTQDVNLPRFRDFQKDVLRVHGAFSGLQYVSPNKKTEIYGGIRLNYFSKFNKITFEPRINIHQKLGRGFSIETLGEIKTQSISQRIDFESDFLGVEKRRWVLSDENNVPIIDSKQVSLGFNYNKRNWLISLEGYHKEVQNISSRNQGFQNQFQFVQRIGNYTVNGTELVINKRSEKLSSWISYAYSKNEYRFKELSSQNFPNNLDITHSATIASSYTFNKLKVAVGFNWHSGKPYTEPLPNEEQSNDINAEILYSDPNMERLPDYYRADISAEYNFNVSKKIAGRLNIAVLNVFDTDNTVNIRFSKLESTDGQMSIRRIKEFSLGITSNASLQFLF